MTTPQKNGAAPTLEKDGFRFLYFADLLDRPVIVSGTRRKLGKLADLVFALKEPYPEAVGLYLEHGWGKPTEFIPWDRVERIDERRAVVVKPPVQGDTYPPFVDQPGWILADAHLIGRTILDLDGRRTEVVNDVHCLESKGHLLLVHVDTSIAGILRRWHLGRLRWVKDELISWKYVQPLSVEDAAKTDQVSLSVTRAKLKELPPEDLADALEELSGEEQEALFSALDSETAADVLVEAEPRAQRQIIADLEPERAREVLAAMTVPEIANVLAALPYDKEQALLALLAPEVAQRVAGILAEREARAHNLALTDYLSFPPQAVVRDVLAAVRTSGREPVSVSYVYVLEPPDQVLRGVVDLRELVLAPDERRLGDLMTAPVVTAEADTPRDALAELFAKYHFRLLPVVDSHDHVLGVVRFGDVMRNVEIRVRD
jgi:CBS domain-containing protein/sporulation protein YlmC with PRC-barrel domain